MRAKGGQRVADTAVDGSGAGAGAGAGAGEGTGRIGRSELGHLEEMRAGGCNRIHQRIPVLVIGPAR